MSLNRLYATRFRNLNDTFIDLGPGINLICGENGSGKTSLLEAAYFLSSARSFRTLSFDPVIQQGADDCLVRGELTRGPQHWQIGVSRSLGGSRDIRVNGEACARASELAELLPTLVLGPESVDLLLGPPESRRRFLNWGLFHVEQDFTSLWGVANRCLRQRNYLLREGDSQSRTFMTWSAQLAESARRIDLARAQYMEKYRPVFRSVVQSVCQNDDVDIIYHRGWPDKADIADIYEREAESDKKRGFTQKGFQRADVRITVNNLPATKVCSRGELKALVWSLILAQGSLNGEQNTLYLIDDLASEFDADHRRRMGGFLAGTASQVLLTGVERQALLDSCESNQTRLFHVKHGQITPDKTG